jgi:hypothetical protein
VASSSVRTHAMIHFWYWYHLLVSKRHVRLCQTTPT